MNGERVQGGETLQWHVGLINHLDKYLTAEKFGNKVNASGTSMRKKQLWTLEQDPTVENVVYIRSPNNYYLSTDKKGNIDASNEERSPECRFTVHYIKDATGRWAFQNVSNTYYLSGTDDNVLCYEKTSEIEPTRWTIRLAVHPQVNMRNVNRKRYVHLSFLEEETGRLQCDETIPWGQDALVTLEFKGGKYSIRSCDNRYLNKDGSLVGDNSGAEAQFTLELRSAGIAFKDNGGKYLMGVGKDAVLQSRSKTVGKDELFTLEDSHPQVYVTAFNNKKVSIKQGVDVTANQSEVTDKETFQLEFDKASSMWRFRTVDSKYWSVEAASGIQAVGHASSMNGLFSIDWLEEGQVSLKANNGKYVQAKQNGSLTAVSDKVDRQEKYYITIMNRPILVLKWDYGFVGFKNASNPRLECNKASLDYITLEADESQMGRYYFKGHNGKYWSMDAENNIKADSAEPYPFILEMRAQSRFAIKAPNGKYIKGEPNGIFSATATAVSKDTLWEY